MYIPEEFKETDKKHAFDYIKEHPFGILVSYEPDLLHGTHIPFEIEKKAEGKYIIKGHMASNNPHSDAQDGSTSLVIFNGPHAYISSSWYSHANVPTWNYLAIHVKGKYYKMNDENSKDLIIKQLLKYEDKSMINEQDEKMINALINSITCFYIEIDDIDMCKKMSQNRNNIDYSNIIRELKKTNNYSNLEVAGIMEKIRKVN
jgi:transcriptional regulator